MSETLADSHGGNVYSMMRKSGKAVSELMDYSANINPLGLAESVRQAIVQSIDQIVHYPDIEAADLKAAISDLYQVPRAVITAGNGAVEMLYVLCNVLRPKKVLITAPAFSEYEQAARAARSEVQYCYLTAENNFAIDIDKVSENLQGIDIVFIGNPNNPTGTLLRQEKMEQLLRAALKCQTYVVADESFLDFLPDDSEFTCRPLLKKYKNLIIIHSLTKFYAIPGLRLGFALANPELTAKMHNSKDPWNVNTLAQNAGVAALLDLDYRGKSRLIVSVAKQELYQSLLEVPGIKPYPPAANFILANITATGFSSTQLRHKLIEKNILIRDCSNYPGLTRDYIRLAVKRPEQNNILVDTLKSILGVPL